MFFRLFALLLCTILATFLLGEDLWALKESPIDREGGVYKKDDTTGVRAVKKAKHSKALAHYTMGIIYDNKGEINLAIQEYKKSLKYNPYSLLARLKLGVDYLVSGDEKKSIN